MADKKRPEGEPNLMQVLGELAQDPAARPPEVAPAVLEHQIALIRTWQSQRLAATYADFRRDQRYRPACDFFLSDIYAPQDFSQRDQDLEHLYHLLARLLPPPTLALLAGTVRLNQLSNRLDHLLAQVLVENLGVTGSLTPSQYAQGYRLCDNYTERMEQIDLITQLLEWVGEGARLPAMGLIIQTARLPATRAGWGRIYDYVARGYRAFKPMLKIDQPFIQAVRRRERLILEQIYASLDNPFEISP